MQKKIKKLKRKREKEKKEIKKRKKQKKNPLVSVIIPGYNEERDIYGCIKTMKEQTYKPIEIIFVDDGSTDRTLEIVKKFKNIKILRQNHRGPGYARNLGAKNAKGEILVLVDSDMVFDKNFVKALTKPIIEEGIIGTIDGVQMPTNPENIWSRCWGRYFEERKGEGLVFRAIQKKEFERLGGFDPKYGYADDRTFFIKYGLKSKRVKDAICYHKNAENLREIYNQSIWIGSSINYKWIKIPLINIIALVLMIIVLPIAIIPLSLRKCYKNKNFKIFFPYMLIFITIRYLGTIAGISKRIFLGKNIR